MNDKHRRGMAPRPLLLLLAGLTLVLSSLAIAQERRIIVAQGAGVNSWDPPADWISAAESIVMNAYDCLVFGDRETGEMTGWLAESWENLDDTTWRLDLRQGVTFHDGTPFTAEDAAFSIDRIISASRAEFIVFDQWAFVESVEIIDDHTIEIVTSWPEPAFLSRLGGTGCGVVSKAYVEEHGAEYLGNNPMGTGPFIVVDYDRASFVQFRANDDYWGGRPEIDELIFRVIPESSTRVAELLTGGVDVAPGVLPQDWPRIEANPDTQMVHYLTDRVWGLTAAHTPPPGVDAVMTSMLEIREAISLAIDREELNDLVGGYGVPTLTRLTPPIPGSDAVIGELYDVNPFDPERARQILDEVGYPDIPGGPELVLHSTFGQGVGHREIAETVAAMLEDVGFQVRLDIRDNTSFRETVYPGNNEELLLQSLGNFVTDPWLFVLNYNSRFGERDMPRDRSSFPEIDELAAQIDVEMDVERRLEMVAEYARMVNDRVISIELLHQPESLGLRAGISWTPPIDGRFMLVNLTFDDD
jgi:peptide/nickel transport system substrate-binding protein